MSAYSASSEEALHDRDRLKDWYGAGLLTEAQYERMQQETVSDLRRTNIFLRVVLFFFTVIIIAAAVALFHLVFTSGASSQTTGAYLLFVALVSYALTEFTVREWRLYRHGIEEALAVCSVGFLCLGLQMALDPPEFFVPAAGAIASLWIWRRFGLAYAFLAAMVFVIWLANGWTSSPWTHRLIVAASYAAGLIVVVSLRTRDRIIEAFLWLGIYLVINIELTSPTLLPELSRGISSTAEFPRAFYWTTWALTWCLPPAILRRGLRRKDRFLIAVGLLTAILTLATNKAYLGWERHTWDLMIFGTLLIATALLVRRWLAAAPNGIRHGYTAERLSGKDEEYTNAASVAVGLVAPQAATHQQTPDNNVRFGGGDSGGAGATSNY